MVWRVREHEVQSLLSWKGKASNGIFHLLLQMTIEGPIVRGGRNRCREGPGRTWSIHLGRMLPFLKGAAKCSFTSFVMLNAVEEGARR